MWDFGILPEINEAIRYDIPNLHRFLCQVVIYVQDHIGDQTSLELNLWKGAKLLG